MLPTLLRLCALQAKPQDLPYSPAWLGLALFAHVAADVLGVIEVTVFAKAVLIGVLDTVLLVALAHTLLMVRQLPDRTVQTLTALAGSGALIGLFAWATSGWLVGLGVPVAASWVPFVIWYLAVFGHVLREALALPYAAALALGVLYFVLATGVTGSFIDAPVPSPA